MINIKWPTIFQKKDKLKNKLIKRCDRCEFFKETSNKYGVCSNSNSHIVKFAYEIESPTVIQV